ncbi:hypothetical protein F2Q68_00016571 [Brassica cretica]|uniref:Uncharacterized protein n=1 Tax=Brassica cretica TaxID=69181 RepID=A0A8S9RXW9_BRACR|nr:hypothetical protein F2Q68_00016571 [Brassica cretica]KAF3585248.1 hypothetical protein F2Q69_00030397 [Brassica cretica]
MSENSTVARICNTAPSECGAKSITLCQEDFKSLSEGAKLFDKGTQEEIEKLKTATEDTPDKASRADAAEYAVEGELRRCQVRYLNKAQRKQLRGLLQRLRR